MWIAQNLICQNCFSFITSLFPETELKASRPTVQVMISSLLFFPPPPMSEGATTGTVTRRTTPTSQVTCTVSTQTTTSHILYSTLPPTYCTQTMPNHILYHGTTTDTQQPSPIFMFAPGPRETPWCLCGIISTESQKGKSTSLLLGKLSSLDLSLHGSV